MFRFHSITDQKPHHIDKELSDFTDNPVEAARSKSSHLSKTVDNVNTIIEQQ